MATVRKYKDEDNENLMRRFKRKVNKEGILSDMRSHEFYQKPSEIKHQKECALKHKLEKKK